MRFNLINFGLSLCLVGVFCQKSTYLSVSKSAGTRENNAETSIKGNSAKNSFTTVSLPLTSTSEATIPVLVCPGNEVRIPLFSLPCSTNEDCSIFGSKMVCCSDRCIRGVPPKLEIKPPITKNNRTGLEMKSVRSGNNFKNSGTTVQSTTKTSLIGTYNSARDHTLICPGNEVRIPFFSFPCRTNRDCSIMGNEMICCSERCIKGVTPPKREIISEVTKNNGTGAGVKTVNNGNSFKNTETKVPPTKKVSKVETNIPLQNQSLICPGKEVRIPFFSYPCATNLDCSVMGTKMICCYERCIKGVPPSKREISSALSESKTTSNAVNGHDEKRTISANILKNTISLSPSTNKPIVIQKNYTLVCPGKEVRIPLFSFPCRTNDECISRGTNLVCCSNRCIKGVPPPKPEIKHAPSWFGLVERQCPVDPIAEILEVKECETDADCSPRICCPDKYRNGSGEIISYCRTAQPSLDRFPIADRLMEPLKVFASYMQCTPPPPPLLDIFPKSCKNTLDCFPNLCCQEGGHKYCRPPKRSVLSFVAGVGQRFVPQDAAKRLIQRLN